MRSWIRIDKKKLVSEEKKNTFCKLFHGITITCHKARNQRIWEKHKNVRYVKIMVS